MVSLIVVAVAATAAILWITDEEEAATIAGSGESVYMQYDWYADLGGFYLVPPAPAPSGESVYMQYDWYADLGGFYLPQPYGDLTADSHYSWLVSQGIIPEAYAATFVSPYSDYEWRVAQGLIPIPEAYEQVVRPPFAPHSGLYDQPAA
jgi:hypothetical protein